MKNNNLNKFITYLGIISGFIAVFIIRRNLAAEASLMNYFNLLPANIDLMKMTAGQLFEIYKSLPLIGLILTNFFDVINVFLVFLLMLPIFIMFLEKGFKTIIPVMIMALGSVILYSIANNSFYYLTPNASIDPEILFETVIVLDEKTHRTLSGNIGLFVFYGYGFLLALMMRYKKIFSRVTFFLGFAANGIGLLYFPLYFITTSCYFTIVIAAPFTIIWYANLSINLLKNIKRKDQ